MSVSKSVGSDREKDKILEEAYSLVEKNDVSSLCEASQKLRTIQGWKNANELFEKVRLRMEDALKKSQSEIFEQEKKLFSLGTYFNKRIFFGRAIWISISFFCLFVVFIVTGILFNRDTYFFTELAMICMYIMVPIAFATLIVFFVMVGMFYKYTCDFKKIIDKKTVIGLRGKKLFMAAIEAEELKLCDMKTAFKTLEKATADIDNDI